MPVMTKGPQGDGIVILSRKEYDQLIAAANEDARDAETLRRSIARVESGEEETFTSAEVDAFLAAKTPLAFFRKKRGVSQDDLAERAGITQGYLSEIEIGRKSGDVRTLRKLANALKVSLDSLVPAERGRHAAPARKKAQSLMKGPTGWTVLALSALTTGNHPANSGSANTFAQVTAHLLDCDAGRRLLPRTSGWSKARSRCWRRL